MTDTKKRLKALAVRIAAGALSLCLLAGMAPPMAARAEDGSEALAEGDDKKLRNGSFEEGLDGQGWGSKQYLQPNQSLVPEWNTTAFEGKIELLKKNSGVYIPGVTLYPSHESVAAELNADEESTLYQTVNTTSSSVYEWGLDHTARTSADTMALVIGPAQDDASGHSYLSKPNKAGRDQFMQMIDWLIQQGLTSVKTAAQAGLGEQFVVYSKKFGSNGTFQDNAGNNPFSMTPSSIYTEEWHIWIIADKQAINVASADEKAKQWGHYGSNAEGSAGSENGNGSTTVDLSKYYLYTVPADQTRTLFGFVSVGCQGGQGPTYGNILDNINFELYHRLSGSSSNHGSAVIGGSNGTVDGESESNNGHSVTVDNKLATFVTHGQPLNIEARITAADAAAGCEFVGVYYTKEENGQKVTVSILKDEWREKENADGSISYFYSLENVITSTDLHFVFIKSPTITYDTNGGKDYDVEVHYDKPGVKNVYTFKPIFKEAGVDGVTKATFWFSPPYVSHAAEGQNAGWKFMGWLLTGDAASADTVEGTVTNALGNRILAPVHTIACDYSNESASQADSRQRFMVYDYQAYAKDDTVTPNLKGVRTQDSTGITNGIKWVKGNDSKFDGLYANMHKGLTMVAQWRWQQAFVPQIKSGGTYANSNQGGSVTVSVTDTTAAYQEAYPQDSNNNSTPGGQCYYAETDETVTVTATPNPGYTFEGWYDEKGSRVSPNRTYSYTESKESVKTFYARFSNEVTQRYYCQVEIDGVWTKTTDKNIGSVSREKYVDAVGNPISSTATAGTNYKFVGWYAENGNLVTTEETLSYTTTGDATYYARFKTAYTVYFEAQTKQPDGTFKTDNVGGKVSVASVKDVNGGSASSTATRNNNSVFLGWYDSTGTKLSDNATYTTTITPAIHNQTFYARFEPQYTLKFVAQTKQSDGSFADDTSGGTVSPDSAFGIMGKEISATATARDGATFLGWYDGAGNQVSANTVNSTTIPANNDTTYYARFEFVRNPVVGKAYLSFVAEDGKTLPSAFSGRNAGQNKTGERLGNTIATGFQYSIDNVANVSTIQIDVVVPDTAYVKVYDGGSFSGTGSAILTDTNAQYHSGSIYRIDGGKTLQYYWEVNGLESGKTYGFIIDNLYAPGATATITVNGKAGTKVTMENGVVNTSSADYRDSSHYPK